MTNPAKLLYPTWEQWETINLDKFRDTFPEFRHSEAIAINQIVSGQYKEKAIDTDDKQKQEVFENFKSDSDLMIRAEQWNKEFQVKNAIKNELLTPTVVGPKR